MTAMMTLLIAVCAGVMWSFVIDTLHDRSYSASILYAIVALLATASAAIMVFTLGMR